MSSRLHHLAALAAVLALGVLGMAPATSGAQERCAGENLAPDATNVLQVQLATLCLLNHERVTRGRVALAIHADLQAVGQSYAEQMVRERFFAHVSPGGTTPLGRIRDTTRYLRNAASWSVGENLGWGSGRLATPRERMQDWMLSTPHRRNILDADYRHTGIGLALGAPVGTGNLAAATYATEFGSSTRQLGSRAGWRASSRSTRCTTTRSSRVRCRRSQPRRTTSSTRRSGRRSNRARRTTS